jgi:hypothetical protein
VLLVSLRAAPGLLRPQAWLKIGGAQYVSVVEEEMGAEAEVKHALELQLRHMAGLGNNLVQFFFDRPREPRGVFASLGRF